MKYVRLNGANAAVDDSVPSVPAIDVNTGEAVQVALAPGQTVEQAAAINNVRFASSELKLFANSIPNAYNFDKMLIPLQGTNDIIYHELYDSSALTTAVSNTPTLFLDPAVTAIYNSNMPGAGRLNNDQRFFMIGIRFELENNDASNPLDIVDVKETFRLGTYQFWVGEKIYNSSKLMRFIVPNAFAVLNTKYYSTQPFATWKLPLPVAIGKNNSFNAPVSLTAGALDNTTRLFAYICGFLYRQVQ